MVIGALFAISLIISPYNQAHEQIDKQIHHIENLESTLNSNFIHDQIFREYYKLLIYFNINILLPLETESQLWMHISTLFSKLDQSIKKLVPIKTQITTIETFFNQNNVVLEALIGIEKIPIFIDNLKTFEINYNSKY